MKFVYCTLSKAQCKCTWAKKSTSAGPYHGEILGGSYDSMILNAAASGCHDTIPPVIVDCDNNGVVSHGNDLFCPLPTNQSQTDILRVFKNLFFCSATLGLI